jgi:hypothetical protein
MWPRANSDVEAVEAADALLKYVERVGISDYLESDGIIVHGGAVLRVEPSNGPTTSDLRLRAIRPDGTVSEK